MVSKAKLQQLEKRISACQDFTQLWAKFFNFFADNFEGRKITGDDEAQFFRVMTELARKTFPIAFTIGSDFPKTSEILGILSEAVSLTNLNAMSEAEFSKFQHRWHVVYIRLNKCLGRLVEQRPMPKSKKGEVKKPKAADDVVQDIIDGTDASSTESVQPAGKATAKAQ